MPGQGKWQRTRHDWVTFTGEGVIVIAGGPPDRPTLRTAFRTLGYTTRHHHSVPMDSTNRGLRAVIARQRAGRKVADIASGGDE
jgi:hypothetical protein